VHPPPFQAQVNAIAIAASATASGNPQRATAHPTLAYSSRQQVLAGTEPAQVSGSTTLPTPAGWVRNCCITSGLNLDAMAGWSLRATALAECVEGV
jgi:hypothetical protein